jgi:protein-S-isoprenylcysteine O-methyltransferase Ste14
MLVVLHLLRAVLYASGFVLLWGWLALRARTLSLGFSLPRWLAGPGYVLFGLGGMLALVCVLGFGVWGRGTPAPFDAPRRFVARGPYRFVRNPMYLGGAAVLAGYALIVRSPAVLLLSGAMLGCAHLFVRLYEEPTLDARFGAEYRAYRSVVRRWWPRWPRRGAPHDA